MAKYKVTFQTRSGRKVSMDIEAVNASNAQDIGVFFEATHGGRIVTTGKDAPKLAA